MLSLLYHIHNSACQSFLCQWKVVIYHRNGGIEGNYFYFICQEESLEAVLLAKSKLVLTLARQSNSIKPLIKSNRGLGWAKVFQIKKRIMSGVEKP